jgi:hypothetical protein
MVGNQEISDERCCGLKRDYIVGLFLYNYNIFKSVLHQERSQLNTISLYLYTRFWFAEFIYT